MDELSIQPFDRLELSLSGARWAFAESRRAEIDARFAELQAKNPALWNGRVLMLNAHEVAGRVFRGSYLAVDYASFLVWQRWGCPGAGAKDCFAQGALRSADGAWLLGVMAPHTAHAGEIYFPSGTPDLDDVAGSTVDLDGSVRREVREETGLTEIDYTPAPGWRTVIGGPLIAHMRVLELREDAETARARIRRFLASEQRPELSDIYVARGPADLDPRMPPFVSAFLRHAWATGG
jgi:8-oxo-dGTP pyrophosphatase MutT (NUDIX family)